MRENHQDDRRAFTKYCFASNKAHQDIDVSTSIEAEINPIFPLLAKTDVLRFYLVDLTVITEL